MLDIRTLIVIIGLIAALIAVVFTVTWRRPEVGGPAGHWAAGFGLAAVGTLGTALRGVAPDALSIVAAALLIQLYILLVVRGLCRYTGHRFPDRLAFSVLAVFTLAHAYWGLIDPSMTARIVNFFIVFSLFHLAGAAHLWWRFPRRMRTVGRLTAAVFLLLAVVYLGHAASAVIVGVSGTALTDPDPLRALAVVVSILGCIVVAMTMLWMVAANWYIRSQEAVRDRLDAERRFRGIFEHSASGIALADASGRLMAVNNAFAELVGLSRASLAGLPFDDLDDPGDASGDMETIRRILSDEADYYRTEKRYRRPDGQAIWADVTTSAVRGDDGLPTSYITVAVDLQEKKAAEAELYRRAEGEAMVQAISTALLAAPYDQIDETIKDALARIGQAAMADRSYIFQWVDDDRRMSNTHDWNAEGVTPQIRDLGDLPASDFDWLRRHLRERSVPMIQSVAEVANPGLWALFKQREIRSLLLIPMVRDEGPIGFLGLDVVNGDRSWTDSEQHLLRIAADTLAGALARQRLEHELRYQAHHDPLTGLLNRRPFEEALSQEIHRLQRYGAPVALIMFDIDHFKAVNDTYGHDAGDRTLAELAKGISDQLRAGDLLARWGGEEFMILLPETDAAGARQVADSLRRQVAEHAFSAVGGLTISLGVAQCRSHETLEDVTQRVDEALYAAKRCGRDRVMGDGEARSR